MNSFFLFLLTGSGLFGLVSLARFSLNLGFVERPIVIALLFALLTSNWQEPIAIGIFFECFWLETFPAGTYLPPQQTFAAFLCILTVQYLGLTQVGSILPLLILALPLTRLMNRLETWIRKTENANYRRSWELVHREAEAYRPEVLVWGSLLKSAALNTAAFGLFFSAAVFGLRFFLQVWPASVQGVSWGHVLAGGLAAGLLSLRSRRVYQALIGAALCLILVLVLAYA